MRTDDEMLSQLVPSDECQNRSKKEKKHVSNIIADTNH
jgi:hypothetical protein